jgi:hypothetical protein
MKKPTFRKLILRIVFVIIALASIQPEGFAQFVESDTASFWSVTYNDWPPLIGSPQRLVKATCKKAGAHCYVFVEDLAVQPTQAAIDTLVNHFDNHWYDSLTAVYGPIPDVFDNDPKICILVINESDWSGYFDPGQQMPDTMVYRLWERHSNQKEIIYVATDAFNYADEIVSHEFGHLLHWQQDHSPEPVINPIKYWEDAWVDEGFSTFAAIYLTENIYQHNILDNEAFFTNNPDIPLIYFSNYNQVKLFMLFMYEHYGHWDYISTLISNQINGMAGVSSTLSQLGYTETFDDAFEQWTIANYVDDTLYAGGKYSYAHYNFPAASNSAIHGAFPTGTMFKTVNPYGADYVYFTATTPKPIVVDFTGQTDSKYRVDLILKNKVTNQVDSILSVPLDASNHATIEIDSLGSAYNKVIMVVMNLDSAIQEGSTASYSYSATLQVGVDEQKLNNHISIFPNPATEKLYVVASNNRPSQLEIRDAQGRLLWKQSFVNSAILKLDDFAQGIYLVSVVNDLGTIVEKIVVE